LKIWTNEDYNTNDPFFKNSIPMILLSKKLEIFRMKPSKPYGEDVDFFKNAATFLTFPPH
jgi:hypothetical protein